jgi:hypothetical protein
MIEHATLILKGLYSPGADGGGQHMMLNVMKFVLYINTGHLSE